jgi:hypothetical protein
MAEGDINTLFGKVAKLDQRVTKIEATQPFLTEILEKNVETNERLAETLHEIRLSMVTMNDKIDAQATAIENMKHDFDEADKKTDERIKSVVQKVETINLEGQFNIREFLKKNFIWLAITVGLGVAYFSTFISFK